MRFSVNRREDGHRIQIIADRGWNRWKIGECLLRKLILYF